VTFVKRTLTSLLLVAFTLLAAFSVILPNVSAQSNYTIDQVDHTVGILYSGNMVVLDTVHVSGVVSDGFTIALPYIYSANVLKVVAYDRTHIYDVTTGVQLPDYSGFYGVSIDFNGASPTEFTVAFILSNGLIADQGHGNFYVEFPAYPSLTQTVGTVNVNVICPTNPTSISITKADGNVTDTSYSASNLDAYTYSIAEANIQVPAGTIEAITILSLNRDISIDVTGTVKAADTYQFMSNTSAFLGSYVFGLPANAKNIAVKDSDGTNLATSISTGNDLLLVNVTFSSLVTRRQITLITVNYDLPGAALSGSAYVLSDFQLFAKYRYVVQSATMTFKLPEGATITSPSIADLESSSTLTRSAYQDALTVTANDTSYVDYLAPQENTIQISYSYNPVWVSLTATFYSAFAAALCSIGAFVYTRIRPRNSAYTPKLQRASAALAAEKPIYETVKGTKITPDLIRDFTDAYEDKKHLTAEIHGLDMKALRGKIPRRQHKAQRATLEARMESYTQTIERTKAIFRGASGVYPDYVKQLDLAEADLTDAQETLSNLEVRQSRGEISIETYKKNIADAQKTRDRAESVINGTLLRLREKISSLT
jgi:hypothetical protein